MQKVFRRAITPQQVVRRKTEHRNCLTAVDADDTGEGGYASYSRSPANYEMFFLEPQRALWFPENIS